MCREALIQDLESRAKPIVYDPSYLPLPIWEYALIAVAPTILALVLGSGIYWTIVGFRESE